VVLGVCCAFVAVAQDKPSPQREECTFVASPKHICDSLTFGKSIMAAKTLAVIGVEAIPTWASVAQRLDPNVSEKDYDDLRATYFHKFVEPRISKGHSVSGTFEEFKKLTRRGTMPRTGGVDRTSDLQDKENRADDESVRKSSEEFVRKWRSFTIVSDPELADLVLEVRRYRWFGFDTGDEQPVSFILVWPKHANPKTDDVIWLEKFQRNWRSSDTLAGVFSGFRASAEKAEKLAMGQAKANR